MTARIDGLRDEVVHDAVEACLDAGNLCMERSSYEKAHGYGKSALEPDPSNSRIYSFLERVQMYRVIAGSDDPTGVTPKRLRNK